MSEIACDFIEFAASVSPVCPRRTVASEMKRKISRRLIAGLKPAAKAYDVNDEGLSGFLLRVRPTGAMSYACRYRLPGIHNPITHTIGKPDLMTPEQAREHAREILAKAAIGVNPKVVETKPVATVGEALDRYLAKLEGKPSARTVKSDIKNHLRPALGRLRCQDLTERKVKSLVSKLEAKGQFRRGGACVTTLRSALRHAGADTSSISNIKASTWTKRERAAEIDEVSAIIKVCSQMLQAKERWPWAIYLPLVVLLTGCRPAEIRTALWDDIDWKRRALIREKHKTSHKTGKPRVVPLSDKAIELLKSIPRRSGNPYVLPGKKLNEPLREYLGVWREVCKRAGVNDLTVYDLRRTFASIALAEGMTPGQIARALGHSDLSAVDGYAWLSRSASLRVAESVAGIVALPSADQQTDRDLSADREPYSPV